MRFLPLFTGSIIFLAGLHLAANAQTFVVPGAYSDTEGPVSVNLPANSAARSAQYFIAASQLASLGTNVELTGLSFRLDSATSAGPSTTFNFSDYEIRIGQMATAFGSISNTFASNISNAVLVRDGALSFEANSFSATGSPEPFGPVITFSTPYSYTTNTALVIEIRHTGSGTSGLLFDGTNVGWGNTAPSYLYGFYAAGATATVGTTTASFPVMSFSYQSAVPEPATATALAGSAALGLAVWLRRRKRATGARWPGAAMSLGGARRGLA